MWHPICHLLLFFIRRAPQTRLNTISSMVGLPLHGQSSMAIGNRKKNFKRTMINSKTTNYITFTNKYTTPILFFFPNMPFVSHFNSLFDILMRTKSIINFLMYKLSLFKVVKIKNKTKYIFIIRGQLYSLIIINDQNSLKKITSL